MATTKSTVVGIRLDHDRRAWIEAEAARLGVSVRGLFEGMIDEARAGGSETPAPLREDPPEDPAPAFRPSVDEMAVAANAAEPAPSEQHRRNEAEAGSSSGTATAGASIPGVGMVTGIPGNIVRGALSLTANMIEVSGRCAANRLSHCALTRRWVDRSL